MSATRIAYLFSRYPVVSQTFCDSEMLALEAAGIEVHAASIHPPRDSLRHERLADLRAPVHYPPPPSVLQALEREARRDGSWPAEMIVRHEREYGPHFRPALRARNALWFARLFKRLGIAHCHVHFANRATHTALFLKEMAGISFSFTAHAQDFMVDLGSDTLLAEMAEAAAFTIAVSDFSLDLLRQKCPGAAQRMRRIYNGLDPGAFPQARPRASAGSPLRILSIGRLIEFKGFHHLIAAVANLRQREVDCELRIVGEGPWRERLEKQALGLEIGDHVRFLGTRTQDQVKRELLDADVFALASIVDEKGASDILPTVITEAMACGLPVVSTTLAGIPEMVDHSKSGILVEPGNEAALAQALADVADPETARRMGLEGKRRANEIFSFAATAETLARDFISLAPEADPPPRPSRIWLVDSLPNPKANAPLAIEHQWIAGRKEFLALVLSRQGESQPADPPHPGTEWLPDGVLLEAEWRAHPDLRARLEALRSELGENIDGEWFFQQARRALWVARLASARGFSSLHGSRASETVVAWIAATITDIPFTGVLEPGHHLPSAIVRRIKPCAAELADPGHDPLRLRQPEGKLIRIGPLKHRRAAQPIERGERESALEEFFAKLPG